MRFATENLSSAQKSPDASPGRSTPVFSRKPNALKYSTNVFLVMLTPM